MNIVSCSTFLTEFEDQMDALFTPEERRNLSISAIVSRSTRKVIGIRIGPSFHGYSRNRSYSRIMIEGEAEPHIDVDAVKEAGKKWSEVSAQAYASWKVQVYG